MHYGGIFSVGVVGENTHLMSDIEQTLCYIFSREVERACNYMNLSGDHVIKT